METRSERTSVTWKPAVVGPLAFALVLAGFLAAAPAASAALDLARFSVTPSTTKTGGHPNLDVLVSFDPPTSDLQTLALHLPAGLRVSPRAAPFCARGALLADLCPLATKVGSLDLVGEALGFEAEVVRNAYNVKPLGAERLRLGVSIFGSASRGGAAVYLLTTARPSDGGLDVAIAGPPREVAGYPVRLKQVRFRLKGVVRRKRRHRRRRRRRALVTNPASCAPATSVLELSAYVGPPLHVQTSSSFTPTGCR